MATASSCPENIVLVGFMGSGKSTVGRILAKRSARFFLDADALIESQMGMGIPKIFEDMGEEYFRSLERESAEWLHRCVKGSVISTGGGMPLVTEKIGEIGTVVYLKLTFEEILKRIPPAEREKRPLFRDLEKAEKIYTEREKIYEKVANITVDATQPPESVAEDIISSLGEI